MFVCVGSTCCRSSGNTTGWGHSAMKLTSRVFSALKDISGSFVAVEDGVLSTSSPNAASADCDNLELAEDAVLEVDGKQSPQKTNVTVSSIPLTELDAADIMPVRIAACTNGNPSNRVTSQQDSIQQSLSSVCSQSSAENEIDYSFRSTSSEFDDRNVEALTGSKMIDDDNIVFSSGTRRRVQKSKPVKGNNFLVTFGCV